MYRGLPKNVYILFAAAAAALALLVLDGKEHSKDLRRGGA